MSQAKFKNPVFKIAILGGISLTSTIMYFRFSLDKKIRSTTSYQEAIKILHSEEFPKKYLGEPIVEKSVNFLSSESSGTEGKWRWIMFGVEGPKNKGFLKYWFSSDNEGHHRLLKVALLDTDYKNVFNTFTIPKKEP